jgi:acetolactate synthase-1/2/3 large subunit
MKMNDKRTGAQALVESLAKAGTDVLFGYPGGAVLDIFNCLTEAKFQFVLGRHEQGCIHMADGYARSTGRPGVCLVTSGPGATNTITGLATANIDGVPLVLITGQVALPLIGTDAFQEADTTGITRAVSKHNFLVHSADEIPETIAQAFYIATHGKPGPVVIDIPKNCQQALTDALYPERVSLRAYHPESAATTAQLNRLAKLINDAARPVIYAGGGVIASGASKDLAALARKAGIPVATTLMGLGAFDEHDPLALRLAGMHGTAAANWALNDADLILALGVRFSDRVTGKIAKYAPKAKIVHIDCDPASIGKNVQVDLGIVADIKDVLTTVSSRVKAADHPAWRAQIEAWRREHPGTWTALHEGVIMPQAVIESIDRTTKGRAVIVTDVGQNQMWAAQHFRHSIPRHFLTSGGMGTMGFGIPAAIGAAFARPNHKTVAVCGDGGAQMTFEEIVVAVEHRLPITFVVLNNGCLGMVRQWQELFYGKNYSGSILTAKGRAANERLEDLDYDYLPDLVKLAEAHGAKAYRVIDPAKLDATIAKAVKSDRTTFVEVIVEPRANVYPMIPAGRPVADMVFGAE